MSERVSNKRGTTHRRGTRPARSTKTAARHQAKLSKLSTKRTLNRIAAEIRHKEQRERKRKAAPPKLTIMGRIKKLWRSTIDYMTTS